MNDNEVLIECKGIKRTLTLPFGICINSKQQAEKIREAMDSFLGGDAAMGWVTVHMDDYESRSDTKPIAWDAAGPNPPADHR